MLLRDKIYFFSSKAFEYQGDCFVQLKRSKEAIQAYGKYLESLGRSENDNTSNQVLRKVILLATGSGGKSA